MDEISIQHVPVASALDDDPFWKGPFPEVPHTIVAFDESLIQVNSVGEVIARTSRPPDEIYISIDG